MNDQAATFAAVFAALYAAHQVGDHWVQTDHDARHKGGPGWAGRRACASHVLSMTITKVVALVALTLVTGLDTSPLWITVALAVDAISHYWADRRTTLAQLAAALPVRGFYKLGQPREGHDDAHHIGTGAYALDQSWHIGWLFVAALISTI